MIDSEQTTQISQNLRQQPLEYFLDKIDKKITSAWADGRNQVRIYLPVGANLKFHIITELNLCGFAVEEFDSGNTHSIGLLVKER